MTPGYYADFRCRHINGMGLRSPYRLRRKFNSCGQHSSNFLLPHTPSKIEPDMTRPTCRTRFAKPRDKIVFSKAYQLWSLRSSSPIGILENKSGNYPNLSICGRSIARPPCAILKNQPNTHNKFHCHSLI